MSHLFTPLTLREQTFRNRIFVSPMCQYSASDGMPGDWHLVHLGSRAVGGAALVIAEATAVSPVGRISPGCAGLWSQAHADAFGRIATFIKAQGAVAGIQLSHAGRKASTDIPWGPQRGHALDPARAWTTLGPSALRFADTHALPRAMGPTDLAEVIAEFTRAARFAEAAGFGVIELHMAHGYLLHEFLSPLSNHRTDGYGGALENRARFPLEVVRAVRGVWPAERPLFARLSCTDWVDGGFQLPEAVEVSRWLQEAGVDLIDCSSGGNSPAQQIPLEPGYQVPFASAVRKAGIPTGAVGLITEPRQAEAILADGAADAVLLARALLRDPYWPLHAAHDLGADVAWPTQYTRAKP